MAGGNWSPTDMPVLPGLYMNFVAAAGTAIQPGARGVVVAPVKAHWGPVGEFIEIADEKSIKESFSLEETGGASAYTTLFLALLGGPKKLLAYRLADNTAAAAKVTLKDTAEASADCLTLTAKYPGERGNDFNVTVQASLVDATKKELRLYEGTTLLRTFSIGDGSSAAAATAINEDADNKWIVAEKIADGTMADVSGSTFTGGNSGISGITNADYITATEAFEGQEFHVLTLDGVADPALRASIVAWVKRVRSEGKGIIATLGGTAEDDKASDAVAKASARSAAFNHEGVVNVGSGAVLAGKEYSSAQVAAWAAGLIAGQSISESTTYAVSPFDDVTRRWTRSEQEQAVRSGVFLLIHDGRQVKVLRGVNTLITLRNGQNNSWKKIRTIRVMDQINADLRRTVEDAYIGKVNNNDVGRLALIGACKEYMRTLAQSNVIEGAGYDVILDPSYYGSAPAKQPEPDQVFLQWNARLTDVMEQIFGTFFVQ
ncbi:phage tail sheath family protein [Paenibacillus thiaminolyticus]|uniref:Phage tail sheath protein n=1 Tax=Paenibacillus thiaminolyticus TaxID=49283 RepID=A0A3A3H8Y9_PANTH|nr:phage tail sheath family protein [Paenibacillus thiaminolyticus]RJG26707.1 phage tail sheath protein [Paenibacillus thiaminolyticus]